LLLAACASPGRRQHPVYWYDIGVPVGFTPEVRGVAENRRIFDERVAQVSKRVLAAADGHPINILALSGGGAGSAFGAGSLLGLSESGSRPVFHVVTGVSAGALTAPFAFLGPQWDDQLAESFSGRKSAGLIKINWTGLLFGSSLLRGKPLAQLVNHYATMDMLRAIAAEAAKGRILLVATTDLDSERTVIWDMGLIAMQGGEAGLRLFRQVLIASASIPGIFPPVMIPVDVSGTVLDEMHVDGSVTASVFIAPEIASLLPDRFKVFHGANVFVLANGQYGAAAQTTPVRTIPIIRRGVSAAMHSSVRGAILAAFALANQSDMSFAVTAIPDDYPYRGILDIKPDRMNALFEFGRRCAREGELWTNVEGLLERSLQASQTPPGATTSCPHPK
jgi:predicted acylesterase/phospholipase RssA